MRNWLRYDGTGVRFSKRHGIEAKLFGVLVVLVGLGQWRGNCYGCSRVFRIDLMRHALKLTWESRSLTTDIYLRPRLRGCVNWNSEHIAVRYGQEHWGEPGTGQPSWWATYNGWLGHHSAV